jgi:hypothetical protein
MSAKSVLEFSSLNIPHINCPVGTASGNQAGILIPATFEQILFKIMSRAKVTTYHA